MNGSVTEELLKKLKEAKTEEEMFEIAREHGLDFTREKAKEYFAQMNRGCP